jgi:hypothetical protein
VFAKTPVPLREFLFKMQKLILALFVLFLCHSCLSFRSYSDEFGKIENVTSIRLEATAMNRDTTVNSKTSTITDPQLISRLLNEINSAKGKGPGKAGYRYKLKIRKPDTTIVLLTSGKIFSYSGDGQMYEFKSKNILKEYWNIDTH